MPIEEEEEEEEEELNSLIRNKNISNYNKAQSWSWFGHVDRMAIDRIRQKIIWVETDI